MSVQLFEVRAKAIEKVMSVDPYKVLNLVTRQYLARGYAADYFRQDHIDWSKDGGGELKNATLIDFYKLMDSFTSWDGTDG